MHFQFTIYFRFDIEITNDTPSHTVTILKGRLLLRYKRFEVINKLLYWFQT